MTKIQPIITFSEEDGIKSFYFKSYEDTFSVGSINHKKNTFIYSTKDGKKVKGQVTGGNNIYVFETDDSTDSENIKIIKSKVIDSIIISKPNENVNWTKADGKVNVFIAKGDEPIFILDGKKVEKSIFEDVDSEDIESVFVLKGEKALEKYGDEGKNGVIVMTKKGSKSSDSSSEISFESGDDEPLFVLMARS